MKVINLKQIDNIKLIDSVQDAKFFIDPEETKKTIIAKKIILDDKTIAEKKQLFKENAVYFNLRSEKGEYVKDIEGDEIKFLLGERKEKEFLKRDKTIIKDNRNKTYWQLKNGKWSETKIKKLGEKIPVDSIWEDDLTKDQKSQISLQNEEERIKNLSRDDREKEKNNALEAVIGSAANYKLKLELEIEDRETGYGIDGKVKEFYNEKKAIIDEKYKIRR
jgi:hypothetical protein